MGDQTPFISVKISTRDPIALADFVGTFTALGNEYERFIKVHYPDLVPTASVYVRQVKKGSIIAELIGWAAVSAPLAINYMDQALIVEDFVRRYAKRLAQYFAGERGPITLPRARRPVKPRSWLTSARHVMRRPGWYTPSPIRPYRLCRHLIAARLAPARS